MQESLQPFPPLQRSQHEDGDHRGEEAERQRHATNIRKSTGDIRVSALSRLVVVVQERLYGASQLSGMLAQVDEDNYVVARDSVSQPLDQHQ